MDPERKTMAKKRRSDGCIEGKQGKKMQEVDWIFSDRVGEPNPEDVFVMVELKGKVLLEGQTRTDAINAIRSFLSKYRKYTWHMLICDIAKVILKHLRRSRNVLDVETVKQVGEYLEKLRNMTYEEVQEEKKKDENKEEEEKDENKESEGEDSDDNMTDEDDLDGYSSGYGPDGSGVYGSDSDEGEEEDKQVDSDDDQPYHRDSDSDLDEKSEREDGSDSDSVMDEGLRKWAEKQEERWRKSAEKWEEKKKKEEDDLRRDKTLRQECIDDLRYACSLKGMSVKHGDEDEILNLMIPYIRGYPNYYNAIKIFLESVREYIDRQSTLDNVEAVDAALKNNLFEDYQYCLQQTTSTREEDMAVDAKDQENMAPAKEPEIMVSSEEDEMNTPINQIKQKVKRDVMEIEEETESSKPLLEQATESMSNVCSRITHMEGGNKRKIAQVLPGY